MIRSTLLAIASIAATSAAWGARPQEIVVETDAYRWQGDTLFQNEFKAWAVSPGEIRSTYHGRPGYFMPVEQTWKRKNDLSSYPGFTTSNSLLQAVYNMALDEMVNAVEPDTTLRTGKEWAGVWTRDVSYSIILSMAALQPEASMISLMKKVNKEGQIIQDTGSGGAWPVSTDRMVWVLAAWEIYKVTGDRKWLETVYPIALRSLEKDEKSIMSRDGLVKGETSFIDWREQSYPRWMQTADIADSEAMGTNVMYAAALDAVARMAGELGKKKEASELAARSSALAAKIDSRFWLPDKGYYGMYTYGYDNKIVNPRAETLGEALAILYDVAPSDHRKSISRNNPHTPYGPGIFFPQISDIPNYHNNALWPFVASYWALAQAKEGNEKGFLEGLGSVVRPAALFATNKENFNLDNGDYFTELNSSNMLWSLSGNLALTQRVLFGIHFEPRGIRFAPFVPESLADTRSLDHFPYRGSTFNLTVEGYGANVASITVNGKKFNPGETVDAKYLRDGASVVVKMDNLPIPPMEVNNTPNVKAPLTPVTRFANSAFTSGVPDIMEWDPIEYIGEYIVLRNGEEVGRTHQTAWPIGMEGEWQVIGVSADGVQSFASRPLSNRSAMTVQMPSEVNVAVSGEISYPAQGDLEGYRGSGFVEIDHSSKPVEITVDIPETGDYSVAFRYANGNGPVNTENKCSVRSLLVNGQKKATVVFPQRGVGNWNDWGLTNRNRVRLKAGKNTLTLTYLPEDENMNLSTNHALVDELIIERSR